jgi:hypothetical protein
MILAALSASLQLMLLPVSVPHYEAVGVTFDGPGRREALSVHRAQGSALLVLHLLQVGGECVARFGRCRTPARANAYQRAFKTLPRHLPREP